MTFDVEMGTRVFEVVCQKAHLLYEADGYHSPMIFMFRGSVLEAVPLHHLMSEDICRDKLCGALRQMFYDRKIDAYAHVTEGWMVEVSAAEMVREGLRIGSKIPPSEDPNRVEILQILLETKTHRWMRSFHIHEGKVLERKVDQLATATKEGEYYGRFSGLLHTFHPAFGTLGEHRN